MDEMVNVTVELKNGLEEEIEVCVNVDDFCELESASEKIHYVKDLATKQRVDIKKVQFDMEDLKELESGIADMNDTSDILPNETYDEFMEHENFD